MTRISAFILSKIIPRGLGLGPTTKTAGVDFKLVTVILLIACLFFSISTFAEKKQYSVEFRDADIKTVIRLLAKLEGRNIVTPDTIEGKVTASFDDIGLKDALKAILKTNGFGYVEEDDVMMVVTKKELAELGEDLIAVPFTLKYAKAETILPHILSLITDRGSAIADKRTNSIYVRDTHAAISNIRGLMATLDRKGKQVLIEAKIIEASVDFVRSLGVQWGVTKSGGKIQTAGVTAVGTDDQGRSLMLNAPAEGIRSSAPLAGVGLILGSFKGVLTDFQLTAAEQSGDANVLARPTIATLNNQAASIRSGTKFYVKTTGDFNIGGTATTQSNLQEIDTGIELKVTPQISTGNTIRMDIEATQSEADFTQAIDGVPAVVDKTAVTTVRLRDGETTIIGGLFHLKDAKTVKGVPGLMRVPILGNLFKSRTKTKTKRELLIFLTPTIIESAVYALPSFQEPESGYNPNPPVKQKRRARRTGRKWR